MKTKDFIVDITRLRREEKSYESIARWLAVNKGFSITGAAVRSAVLVFENEKKAIEAV